jgi:hypothetical protein
LIAAGRLQAVVDWVLVSRRRQYATLFLATLGIYLLTAHYFTGQISDTEAVIWPAYEFVHHGTFHLESVHDLPKHNEWFIQANGHLAAGRMMGPILAGVPVCALLAWTPLTPAELNSTTAAVYTAIAMVVLFAALRRLVDDRVALAAFIVVAFGSAVWTVAAGELWPQTVDVLFICLMLLALARGRVGWAGIALAPALTSRPHLALVALIMGVGLAIGRRSWRPLFGFGVPAAVALALLFPWNRYNLGSWQLLGTYSAHVTTLQQGGGGVQPFASSALQAMFSPMQGLLLYTPVLLLAVVWIVRRPLHAPGWTGLALLSGLIYQVVQLRVDSWTGGAGFVGSRLTLELLVLASPIAAVCYPPWAAGHPLRRFSASILAGAGVVLFSVTAVLSDYRVGGRYHTFWTTFYPWKVVRAAGPQGLLISSVAIVAFLIFVVERYRKCFAEAAVGVVAPREPSEDETFSAQNAVARASNWVER